MPRATSPALILHAHGATDSGKKRSHNEDAILVRPDLRLFAVADGAGGHSSGNTASALALVAIAAHFESTERAYRAAPDFDRFGIPAGERRLSAAIRKANREIFEISRASKKHSGMGSTVVAVTVAAHAHVLHVAHAGDSRCYRLRAGIAERLTHDHSLLHEVIESAPEMPEEAIAKLPRKVVTRALGMMEDMRVTVRSFEIAPDDVYLLCSDGLTGELTDEQIRRVLALADEPRALVERLVAMANDAGGSDNIAALLIRCEVVESAAEAALASPADPEPVVEVPPPRPPEASAPEILLLGIESEPDLDEAARLMVVPGDGVASPVESRVESRLIDALDTLVLARRQPPRLPCSECGEMIEPESFFCTRCGEPRPGA